MGRARPRGPRGTPRVRPCARARSRVFCERCGRQQPELGERSVNECEERLDLRLRLEHPLVTLGLALEPRLADPLLHRVDLGDVLEHDSGAFRIGRLGLEQFAPRVSPVPIRSQFFGPGKNQELLLPSASDCTGSGAIAKDQRRRLDEERLAGFNQSADLST